MTNNEKLQKIKEALSLAISQATDREGCMDDDIEQYFKDIEKDLQQVKFLERKNDDLWETIRTLSQNASVKKDKISGIEIKITLNSWQKDFDKIAWVFGCQRR